MLLELEDPVELVADEEPDENNKLFPTPMVPPNKTATKVTRIAIPQ